MKIPITMCHGLTPQGDIDEFALTAQRFDRLMGIAAELGFKSINYDQLADFMDGRIDNLPAHPIMIDFNHPDKTIGFGMKDILANYGFKGNLFVNTGAMDPRLRDNPTIFKGVTHYMTWDDLGRLYQSGWTIGAHTHTHPSFTKLLHEDPTGQRLLDEFETCDSLIEKNLGFRPQDFAFTGISWTSKAEDLVKQRYRFGRLWITLFRDPRGSQYEAEGKYIRFAELVGVPGDIEPDGGPPTASRYITAESNPYLLPSMEIVGPLIYSERNFREYLLGALGIIHP